MDGLFHFIQCSNDEIHYRRVISQYGEWPTAALIDQQKMITFQFNYLRIYINPLQPVEHRPNFAEQLPQ